MSRRTGDEHLCLNLRCKRMYYEADGVEGEQPEKHYGDADTTMYWCECTQTGRGPDDQPVHRRQCSLPTRACFEGIHSIT